MKDENLLVLKKIFSVVLDLNKTGVIYLIIDKNSKTMHNKFFIVDREFVITGSMNPSKSGTSYNDEFFLVIQNKNFAKKI